MKYFLIDTDQKIIYHIRLIEIEQLISGMLTGDMSIKFQMVV